MRYLLGALVLLVIADGIMTQYLVGNGIGQEANRLLQPFVDKNYFHLLKISGALLSAAILWDLTRRSRKIGIVTTSFMVFLYTGVVGWNLSMFLAV